MDTKLKKKIKSYITGVWPSELVIFIILTFITISSFSTQLTDGLAEIGASPFDSLKKNNNYVEKLIYYDSQFIAEKIYKTTDNLKNIQVIESNNNYIANTKTYNNANNIFYVIVEKETGKIATNDTFLKNKFKDGIATVEDVQKHVKNGGNVGYSVDNVTKLNPYVENNEEDVDKTEVSKYYEFYYSGWLNYQYVYREKIITAQLMIICLIITVLLGLKIFINFFTNRKKVMQQLKSIKRMYYVFRYGFKYKYTRNKLLLSIIATLIIIFAYLYLVGGIRTQNVLITFLSRYPFKGTLVLVLIPLGCVVYSLKKTLDISVINEGLKEIKEGNLEYEIADVGEKEIKELLENIKKIREGYKIAVDEKIKNEKLKTELISNVSHDLKTPLTSIINYVNILKNENITIEERKEYLDILESKSNKLKLLIDDLFEVSKLNSGKMKLDKIEIDVLSLLYQVIGEYSFLYEEDNINFKVKCDKEEIYMNLDGKLMSRVFENIVINSLKYSMKNTRVFIDIKDHPDEVEISFKNISNYEMDFDEEEIFERFARGDKSRNSAIEGSGIGLAITKSIVELHGGEVTIETEGDMFKLYIRMPKNI